MAFGRKFLQGVNQIIQQIKQEAALPRGTVCWFYLTSAPVGWVICNGLYYNADGTKSNTIQTDECNIVTPDLIGRYARGGYSIGTYLNSSLPNITGHFGGLKNWGFSGAFVNPQGTGTDDPGNNKTCYTARKVNFDANSSNAVYGRNATYPNEVIPESVVLLPCMKL